VRASIRSTSGLLAVGAMAICLVGCETYNGGSGSGPGGYPSQAQRGPAVPVGSGRIIGVQDGGGGGGGGGTTGIGTIGGGVAGALVGASVGHGKMGILTGIAGALGGAMLGNAIERSASGGGSGGGGGSTEFIVARDDGSTVTVRQANDQNLQTGDRVTILEQGGRPYITRQAGGAAPAPTSDVPPATQTGTTRS